MASDRADIELWRAWRAGDQAAGRSLYDRHAPALHRFFRSKVAGGDADLMQQTFLACFERADAVASGQVRAYLFAVARNLVVDRYRRRGVVEPVTSSVAQLDPSLGTVLHARHELAALLGAVRRIPFDDQVLIELHYWERLTTAEIAEVLAIPQGTIKGQLVRARERVREALAAALRNPSEVDATLDGLDAWADDVRGRVEH
ncbi:MAG: sigma-70 family RNA polymerase sigma factor [Nannocystaceae bacterium]